MQSANVGWGAPRIHGELLKLGIEISQATVSNTMKTPPKPPSQAWRTFLANHADCLTAMDFFTVPTATFRILYGFIVLSHDRRQIVHFNVTEHPTAQWTAQQIVEAFPFDTAPRYLLRDRDSIYGKAVRKRINSLGIEDVVTAPRSPWQNPYVERVIGSIRRDCLDHIIVINERHLRRILRDYIKYYHTNRTHLSLNKDPPKHRPIELPGEQRGALEAKLRAQRVGLTKRQDRQQQIQPKAQREAKPPDIAKDYDRAAKPVNDNKAKERLKRRRQRSRSKERGMER